MSETQKKMAAWSSMGSIWLQRAGPSGDLAELWFPNCFKQTEVFSSPQFGLHAPTVHLAAALLLVQLGGELDRGAEAAENQPLLSLQVIFCLGQCASWLGASTGRVVGRPEFARLAFVAEDVGGRLLAVH